jgi:hypothetical protein
MNRLLFVALLAAVACRGPVARQAALDSCAPTGTSPDSAAIAGCLQQQYQWSTDSAGRAARSVSDSLAEAAQRRQDDSAAAARAEQMLAGVNDATVPVSMKQPDDVALSMVWVGSKRTKLYYRGHCAAARAIADGDREQFTNDRMAEKEGYKRSSAPADSACYTAPGF